MEQIAEAVEPKPTMIIKVKHKDHTLDVKIDAEDLIYHEQYSLYVDTHPSHDYQQVKIQYEAENTSSQFIGVSWESDAWRVRARFKQDLFNLGRFLETEEVEAGKKYDMFVISAYQTCNVSTNNLLNKEEKATALSTPYEIFVSARCSATGVRKHKGSFQCRWYDKKKEYYKTFATVEAATAYRAQKIFEIQQEQSLTQRNTVMPKKAEGIPIIYTNAIKGIVHEILVDEQYFNELCKHNWTFNEASQNAFSTTYCKKKHMSMAEVKKKQGETVDHIFQNHHDCRIASLRYLSSSGQSQNKPKQLGCTSQYLGVYISRTKKWVASVRFQHKMVYYKTFATELAAARAYNAEVVKYYDKPMLNTNLKRMFLKLRFLK